MAVRAFNRVFHERIYSATLNSFMAEQAQDVRARHSAFHNCSRGRPDTLTQDGICQVYRIRKSRDEHDAIMQAIAEGDGETASRTRGGKPLVRWQTAGDHCVPRLYPEIHGAQTMGDGRVSY